MCGLNEHLKQGGFGLRKGSEAEEWKAVPVEDSFMFPANHMCLTGSL
jgi:hypothetical protein